jgi:hypothetical protein
VKRKPNPILGAIKFRGPFRIVFVDGWDERKDTQLEIIRKFFPADTIYEVGATVLWGILLGDNRIVGTVREAVKASHHLFNRDRELVLLKRALRYTLRNWAVILDKNRWNMQESVEELKAGIEKHCNHGAQLEQYQWTRLKQAFGLPKRSTVRSDRKAIKPGEQSKHLSQSQRLLWRCVLADMDPAPPPKKRRRSSTK